MTYYVEYDGQRGAKRHIPLAPPQTIVTQRVALWFASIWEAKSNGEHTLVWNIVETHLRF